MGIRFKFDGLLWADATNCVHKALSVASGSINLKCRVKEIFSRLCGVGIVVLVVVGYGGAAFVVNSTGDVPL